MLKSFQTAVLEPNKKSEKKLREKLYALYGNLDKSASEGPEVIKLSVIILILIGLRDILYVMECSNLLLF